MWKYIFVVALGILFVSQLPIHVPTDQEPTVAEEELAQSRNLLGRAPRSPFDLMVISMMLTDCVPELGIIPTGWVSIGLIGETVDEAMRQALFDGNHLARIRRDCLRKNVETEVNNLRATASRLEITLEEIGTSEEKLQLYIKRGCIAEWEYWTALAQYYLQLAEESGEWDLYLQGIESCLSRAKKSLRGEVFGHYQWWKPSWW